MIIVLSVIHIISVYKRYFMLIFFILLRIAVFFNICNTSRNVPFSTIIKCAQFFKCLTIIRLRQGWETSLASEPDLLKKFLAGRSICEKVYLIIKTIYIRGNVWWNKHKIGSTVYSQAKKSIFVKFYYEKLKYASNYYLVKP